jgi:hypothetical protein
MTHFKWQCCKILSNNERCPNIAEWVEWPDGFFIADSSRDPRSGGENYSHSCNEHVDMTSKLIYRTEVDEKMRDWYWNDYAE